MSTSISEELIVTINGQDPMYDDTFTVYPSRMSKQQLEAAIVLERLDLYNLGKPCGALALRKHLMSLGVVQVPSASTIHRILARYCLTNKRTGYYPQD